MRASTAMRHLSFAALAHTRHGNTLMAAGAMLALGVLAGAAMRPALMPKAPVELAHAATTEAAPSSPPLSRRLDASLVYPAEVIRVIDGDTFQARVRVWPGLDVDTKVRLRGIDAAELHARCDDERVKAEAARAALQTILAEGGVAISRVGVDKYGGRVDASASTRNTADVSAAMLNGGWARVYDGRKRGSWC
jgi:endonuclease YncB( thermonuclease family)